MSEFFDAIRAGDQEVLSRLLDENPALVNAAEEQVSPVLMALYHGKVDIARMFVERGAIVGFPEACAIGDLSRVRSMLERDPSLLDQRSADGYPPLGLSIFFSQPAVARFLIERGADVDAAAHNTNNVAPVHAAAAVRDRETMRLLLARRANPNARQQRDYTAMHGAASRGDIEMGELLLANGADPDVRGSDGMTPADVAVKYGHPHFAQWIRNARRK